MNALRTGARIAIGKDLTAVFGENASGKSGYARVMKTACTARSVDRVLPNVYAAQPAQGPPSAIFEIEESGTVRDEKWEDGKPSPLALRRFAVFDAKCGHAYISESHKLSFLPWAFDVLDKLASLTKEVKDQFTKDARALKPDSNALTSLIDDTSVGKLIASISVQTNSTIIESGGKWETGDDLTLTAKESELLKLRANSPAALRQTLNAERKRIETLHVRLKSVEGALTDEKVKDARKKTADFESPDQAVKAAAAMAFGDAELKGIGSDAWRTLLFAAAKYSTEQAYLGEPFPATLDGVRCVLCLQPLSDGAQARLKKFWDFLHDEASTRRDAAKRELDELIRSLDELVRTLPQVAEALEDLVGSSQPELWSGAKTFFESAAGRAKSIGEAMHSDKWGDIQELAASVIPQCVTQIELISTEISKVKDEAQTTTQIEMLSKEVEEFQSRRRLSKNLPLVIGHLESLKASNSCSTAADAISTLSITNKTKDLQKRYVTDAFRKSFQNEINALKIRRPKADIVERSKSGKVLHEVTLGGATTPTSPDQVLSEGEQTAISLAYFLADLGGVEETCGIIFDDPLTSLDHRVRENVVNRLVSETNARQVVVFTHDLAVYSELEKAALISGRDFQGEQVEALGEHIGIVSDDEPWDVMDVGKRISHLDELLKDAVAAEMHGDTKAFRELVSTLYGRLRSTWERSVEELVFNKVVRRYDTAVKTQALSGVAVDTATVEAIYRGMTRTSQMIEAHDHSASAHQALPSSEELRSDLDAFKKFNEAQRAKRKAAEKERAHPKN